MPIPVRFAPEKLKITILADSGEQMKMAILAESGELGAPNLCEGCNPKIKIAILAESGDDP